MKNRMLTAIVALLSIPFSQRGVAQNQNVIRLQCEYQTSLDLKTGESSRTGGKKLITVSVENGKTVIRKEGLGAIFQGISTEEEISGETAYKIGSLQHNETLNINRYTGKFENLFRVGEGRLLHKGICIEIRPLF